MKRRARWVTIGAAALGVAILAVLLAVHRRAVRDHVEAWRFQLERRTETITPGLEPAERDGDGMPRSLTHATAASLFHLLADCSGHPVTFSPAHKRRSCWIWIRDEEHLRPTTVVAVLKRNGWRVLEQRFPERAFVVVHADAEVAHEAGIGCFTTDGE